jgi:lipoprotein-releasing system permease protein
MGGLQNGLISRSKEVLGVAYSDLANIDKEVKLKLIDELQSNKINFYPEYEIELMVKRGNRVSPAILHGIDFRFGIPKFLKEKDTSGIVIGSDLSTNINGYYDSNISFISPAHVDILFGDIPRQVSENISDFYMSELVEIDSIHAWTRIALVQNLIRSKDINKIVYYTDESFNQAKKILIKFQSIPLIKWEEVNKSLVWALALETNVMLFLFVGMSFLVAICITSGFMIFFDKIKTDLISFWVLGKSKEDIFKMSYVLTHIISFIFCSSGLILGILFLYLLKSNDINFMPDFFVERRIPVKIDSTKILISFIVPYVIAVVFSYFSFTSFKKESSNFLKLIKSVG